MTHSEWAKLCYRCHESNPGALNSLCPMCHELAKQDAKGIRPVREPEPHSRPPRYFPPDGRVRTGNSRKYIISARARYAMQEMLALV